MKATMSTISWMTFAQDGPPYPAALVEDVLAAARKAGFDAVGLDLVTLAGAGGSVADGLTVTDVGVLRVGADDATRAAAEIAAIAGNVVCPTVLSVAPEPAVLRRLADAAEVLHGHGIRLALEFMAYGPVGSLTDAIAVCERIGWERCGLLLDSWHLMHAGTPWEQVAELSPDQIALVQVSDAQRLADGPEEFFLASRWGRLPPGEGHLDFSPFLEALAATGYDGWLSPEVLSFGAAIGDPAEVALRLRRAVDHLGVAP